MATETRTVEYTVYVYTPKNGGDTEEYRTLYAFRKAHKEFIFSSKAEESVLSLIGLTKETRTQTVEVEIPEEEEEVTEVVEESGE